MTTIFKNIFQKIPWKFSFFHRIRFTQTTVLTYGVLLLLVFIILILGWDASLFMQSLSSPQATTINESKKMSLTSQDIDDAIHILDQRQQKFNALLKGITGTTTISF